MKILKICIITPDDGLEIAIHINTDEDAGFIIELLLCFGNISDGVLKVNSAQKATKELKQKISEFTKENSRALPSLNKLNKIISKVAENQYFLILNQPPNDTTHKYYLHTQLKLLNESNGRPITEEEFTTKTKPVEHLFGELMKNYNIHNPRSDRRTIIGNTKKDLRKCRFCGGTMKSGRTFSKTAHAIPEALGNKNLIIADECDECNEYFGNNIEPNLISHLDIHRVFLGVRGKNGPPTIKYTNGKILNKDESALIIAEDINISPNGDLTIKLRSKRKITPVKIYKSLCKITLSTITNEVELDYLSKTLHWLRYDETPPRGLPKVAEIIAHNGFSKTPTITNYIRKSEDRSFPHIVSEFRFGSLVYVYVIPLSDKDSLDFVDKTDFDGFWSKFKHYSQVPGWHFENIESADELVTNETIIRMTNSKSEKVD